MWIVEDFRDAPMRPRAMFENESDAREWARVKFGSHAYVHQERMFSRDEAIDIVADSVDEHDGEDAIEVRDAIESALRGAA